MHIYVDADACPAVIKEILFRAAERVQVSMTLVANRLLRVPPSPYIKAYQVPGGFDVADHWIVEQLQPDDLVITADIPLAAEVIAKDGPCAEPARRALFEGQYSTAFIHAKFLGSTAQQRRGNLGASVVQPR